MAELEKDLEMAHRIAKIINSRGGKVYYVGGYVRDKLIGRENKDIDIEVYGVTPDELKNILSSLGSVKTQGAAFGVYNLKGYDIDIAQPRKETTTGRGHKDFEVFVDPFISEENAAKRRDFTINAIMQNVLTNEIVDPYHGKADLAAGIIRHIDDKTFTEDSLRVFRAAQFAARFDFKLDPETKALIKTISVDTLSHERVYEEMKKALLKAEKPSIFFKTLRDTKQLNTWFPEIIPLIGCIQSNIHHPEGDVWNHTMIVLDEAAKMRDKASNAEYFMIAALCHDMGKPLCTTVDDNGNIHAYQHEQAGVTVAKQFLDRLNTDTKLCAYVLNMTANHMKPHHCFNKGSRIKTTNHMFDNILRPEDLCLLAAADISGRYSDSEKVNREITYLFERLDIYNKRRKEPMVTGKDLIAIGLRPSPEFSEILMLARKMHFSGVDKTDVLKDIIAKHRKNTITEK